MRFDLELLDASVNSADIGGYVAAALNEEPFVHLAANQWVDLPQTERRRRFGGLSEALGDVVLNRLKRPKIEEVTGKEVGFSFHTDHPYLERPEQIVGLMALKTPVKGSVVGLLSGEDIGRWHSMATPLERANANDVFRGFYYFRGPDGSVKHGMVVTPSGRGVRFDEQCFVTESERKRASLLTTLFRTAAAKEGTSVTLWHGDMLFFHNRSHLHRVLRPNGDEQTFLRTRVARLHRIRHERVRYRDY